MYPICIFDKHNLFAGKIVGANISLFYYGGFSYVMLRRYNDAARCFNIILAYLNRVKQYHQRSTQYDQVSNLF